MTTRSQSVTEELRALLLSGRISQGEHLQEQPLADRLGVSRTPLRAALATLNNEGILEYTPKRGYVVRAFNVGDVTEAWQIRAWLEGLAALRAAERGLSRDAEQRLRALIEQGDNILAKGVLDPDDLGPYRSMNVAFHAEVIRISDSVRLGEMIGKTLNIPMVSNRIIPWDDFEHIKRSHDDHHRIFDAIRSRETWRAEALMREHIYSGIKRLNAFDLKEEWNANSLLDRAVGAGTNTTTTKGIEQ